MNTKKELITSINKNYILLGKYEDALHTVKNLWLPSCVVELLEEKIKKMREKIKKLEKKLDKPADSE